jgi:biopolymer transport protein TolQ
MNVFLNIALAAPAAQASSWNLIVGAGPMVKFVMLVLVLASVFCWAIILAKYFVFKEAKKETELFLDRFYEGENWDQLMKGMESYSNSPLAHLFRAACHEIEKGGGKGKESLAFENVIRSLRRAITAETTRLEKAVYFLATTGSTAPFIGLFGTVWGIMTSFQNIGSTGVANLAVVAPGISEALIATAMGLAAAIPAVVAFNYFQARVRLFTSEMESFSSDFINMIKRGD